MVEKASWRIKAERLRRETFPDNILGQLKDRGYSLAQLLEYMFNSKKKHSFDWRWKGFFAQGSTVQRVLNYWTSSSYNKTTCTFVHNWATQVLAKAVGKESQKITKSGLLQKRKMIVNEEFFMKFTFTDLTSHLRKVAPTAFRIFDAFSTTKWQLLHMTPAWAQRKQIVSDGSLHTTY